VTGTVQAAFRILVLDLAQKIMSSSHSFIVKTYIAPLQDTTTQRRSQPSRGQRRM